MDSPSIQLISECFIKPHLSLPPNDSVCYLTPWDIAMLSIHYIQKGLLFHKPTNQAHFIPTLLQALNHSLSLTLLHFYPLTGRLVTLHTPQPHSYSVFVDCNNTDGVRFIHATSDVTISQILSPVDVPSVFNSFFDHHKAVNHDGHTLPLLSIQVTDLLDGVFIGCSMNHAIADGTSFWKFLNAWSEIFQSHHNHLSIHPIHTRYFPEGCGGPLINLPFKHHDEFLSKFESPQLRETIFHFTAESLARLKAKANREANTTKISTFQSLSALVWRCITRARDLPYATGTIYKLAADNRKRMEPPLAEEYFGNMVHVVCTETTSSGELVERDLGWAAWRVHIAVAKHDEKAVRDYVSKWVENPMIGRIFDPCSVMMGSSPRFDMYGNHFGMGKPVAIRSGYANKFDGKVTSYPGYEGGGTVDLEVCLLPHHMNKLESDHEFLAALSS